MDEFISSGKTKAVSLMWRKREMKDEGDEGEIKEEVVDILRSSEY